MPNMVSDGFLVQANVAHASALLPANSDYALQNAVAQAIGTASVGGAFTCTVSVAAYAAAIINQMIERLVNMGYTASLSSTTLTVNW